jgi:hypothetical protein
MKKIFLLMIGICLLVGCSKAEKSKYNYAGPGSDYTIEIDTGTTGDFSITEKDAAFTVSGTFETLSSGFKEMTITPSDSDPAGLRTTPFYAADIPGFMLVMEPLISTSDTIVTAIKAGECPSEDINGNWLVTSYDDDDDDFSDNDSSGTFSYDISTDTATLPKRFTVLGVSKGEGNPMVSGGCTGGVGEITSTGGGDVGDDDIATMYYSDAGAALVRVKESGSDDQQIIIMLPSPDAPVAESDLEGSYYGLVMFSDHPDDSIQPIQFDFNAAGSADIREINIETGITATSNIGTATINTANVSEGLHKASFEITREDADSPSGNLMCASHLAIGGDATKAFLFCVGEEENNLFNVLLIKK